MIPKQTLGSHLQAAEEQNTTNKATFAKSTPSDAFYYTCTIRALLGVISDRVSNPEHPVDVRNEPQQAIRPQAVSCSKTIMRA